MRNALAGRESLIFRRVNPLTAIFRQQTIVFDSKDHIQWFFDVFPFRESVFRPNTRFSTMRLAVVLYWRRLRQPVASKDGRR
jgi:hypothetical protein